MDPISMLQPNARCVRNKMGLFLRLWITRHRYEQLRPFGRTSRESLRFHLRQLQALWARVVMCQKALGLDVSPFTPPGYFEAVYVISGYAQREVDNPRNAAFELTARWREYVRNLEALSHEINPFDFADHCARCARIVDELNGDFETGEDEKTIRMDKSAFDLMTMGRAALF